jgi:CBS domain-containing protein
MLISDYISKDFPAFEIDSSIEEVLDIVQKYGFTHVFVKKNDSFLGAICKEFLEENEDGNLADALLHLERFAILEDNLVLDSIKLFHIFNTNIVPVIDKKETYLGYIAYDDVFNDFSRYPLFSENGAVITVETNAKSYSMMEIAKIVEGNNCKFYGAFISHVEEDSVQVTMKISNENLSSVDETFERFGYHVVYKFYNDEKEEMMKDRYQYFQKYLEF